MLTTLTVMATLPLSANTVLNITDFGAKPNDGGPYSHDDSACIGDDTVAFQKALETAKKKSASGPVTLRIPAGTYDFFTKNASKRPCFTSNSTEGNSRGAKVIAIDIRNINNLTIEAKDVTFMMRGKFTMMVVDGCKNFTLNGGTFDFKRPTMSEMTCIEKGDGYWIAKVHPDSDYEITGGKRIHWLGEGWSLYHNMTQHYDPKTQTTWRASNPLSGVTSIKQLDDRKLRIEAPAKQLRQIKLHTTYQMRSTTRNAVAMWFNHCKDVLLKDVTVRAIHGFGILGQFSENITLDHLVVAPDPKSGRTNASAADITHFSGCKGVIKLLNCTLTAAHDDALNVHGTHLKIVDMPAKNQAKLRFGQHQSWGFQAFFPGDEIEWVDHETLLPHGSAKVTNVKILNPHEQLVTFSKNIPKEVEKNDVVENITWTPSVVMKNCKVAQIPTRGILLTTRRPILVEGNTFYRTRMPAILCEDDANGWFESGPIHNLTIKKNTFIHCGSDIDISPQVRKFAGPVHKNITIDGNTFIRSNKHSIALRHCDNVKIQNNTFQLPSKQGASVNQFVSQRNASNVTLKNNHITAPPRKFSLLNGGFGTGNTNGKTIHGGGWFESTISQNWVEGSWSSGTTSNPSDRNDSILCLFDGAKTPGYIYQSLGKLTPQELKAKKLTFFADFAQKKDDRTNTVEISLYEGDFPKAAHGTDIKNHLKPIKTFTLTAEQQGLTAEAGDVSRKNQVLIGSINLSQFKPGTQLWIRIGEKRPNNQPGGDIMIDNLTFKLVQ